MPNDNVTKLIQPGSFEDPLTQVLRDGARTLLAQAVEAEVAEFLAKHTALKTEDGRARVVRHGHLPERQVMTGIGPVAVRQPRIRDRGVDAESAERIRFTPAILPPYARRSKSLEVLIPILYLKGISTGDFWPLGLAALGPIPPSGPLRLLYVLAQSLPRIHKERAMRRRKLKWLWARLKQISAMKLDRKELLMKLGDARGKAREAAARRAAPAIPCEAIFGALRSPAPTFSRAPSSAIARAIGAEVQHQHADAHHHAKAEEQRLHRGMRAGEFVQAADLAVGVVGQDQAGQARNADGEAVLARAFIRHREQQQGRTALGLPHAFHGGDPCR